jgi:hypothetical protein
MREGISDFTGEEKEENYDDEKEEWDK